MCASTKEEWTKIAIVHSRSSNARDDNKVGPSNDFVNFWHSFALTLDECTSQLPRNAFPGSDNEVETQIAIVHSRSSDARDDKKVGSSNDFTFDECTSQLPRAAFPGSDNEGETQIAIVHSRSSDARDDNKVGPSNDFVDFWPSFALTFDECTSQLLRDAFPGSDNEGETQIAIVHSRSSDARDDNKVGPSNDFVDFWPSFALTFDECTSQLLRDAFPGSDNEGETQIAIVHSRSSDARDDNKVGPSNDFVDFWPSFALTFDECTSQLLRDAFPGSDNEGETQIAIVHSRSSDARDDNKVGPSNDFVDFWPSFALTFDECTSQLLRDAFPGSDNEGETQIAIVHSRSSDARDDNKVGPSNDFVDFWPSFALTFDECTSQLLRDAFPGSDNEGETQIAIVHSRSSDARDDNKVGPSNDFVDFWPSFALTFDECTSQLPRAAFPGSDNEGETQIEIVHSRSSDARDDTRIEPMIDFDLNFEEWS
ncbi:hypothetical protein V1478_015827 [Vespula squamosa]|uniref:Uncharacterized protein n=1 Tax=Vespula squamosa TaxID=30214 RepID=A0ABD2A2E2_VESSQ